MKGFGPSTSTLARWRSTTELHPREGGDYRARTAGSGQAVHGWTPESGRHIIRRVFAAGGPSMFMKLAWRVVASGALILCVGCGSSGGGSTASCDPCERRRSARRRARRPPPRTRPRRATRDRLLRKAVADGPREARARGRAPGPRRVQLGRDELLRGLVARRAHRGRRYRAQMGLARCADAQNQNYSARVPVQGGLEGRAERRRQGSTR